MAPWNFNRLGLRSRSKPSTSAESFTSSRRPTRTIEQFEQRMLMAISPSLVAIIPNEGAVLNSGDTRHTAPNELTIRFDVGQTIAPASVATGIQVVRSGGDGTFGPNTGDVTIAPGYIGIGDNPNEVIVRFADALPDDFYQLTIFGQGAGAIKNTSGQAFNNGTNLTTSFRLDLGAEVLAVVPQPVKPDVSGGPLLEHKNQIDIYFNQKLDPTTAQTTALYQLIFTNNTATNADDVVYLPSTAKYSESAEGNIVTLTFLKLNQDPLNLENLASGPGSYRLRIGDDTVKPNVPFDSIKPIPVDVTADAGSSISTAKPLGELTSRTQILNGGTIFNDFVNNYYGLTLPGGIDIPGHRDIPAEAHVGGAGDSTLGISTRQYNFQSLYGTDPQGNQLYNLITEEQKQRAREIFEIYGNYLGVKFVETASAGFTIVTGDLRALDPSIPTGPGGVAGLAGGSLAIMDAAEYWGDSRFGGGWFNVAMHEIGHLLGLGHTYDLPAGTVMGSESDAPVVGAEPVFPGDADIIHGQYLYRPESKDVDFYRFQLTAKGKFTAETIAEQLPQSSLLDTVISLYDASGNLIARNDDYFSSDSFLDLQLDEGTYYIAVSSTGNTNFNPAVADSGFGGTTEGNYTLRLNFDPTPTGTVLLDANRTAVDGNNDGTAGGEYNFWFTVATTTLYVDKTAKTAGANGSFAHPYNNIATALALATEGSVVRILGNAGADGKLSTSNDAVPYEIGRNVLNDALSDGATMDVPKGVTVVIDGGAVIKLRQANINVGSFAQGIDLGRGALQVLGTPTKQVYFTSYNNALIGNDTNPLTDDAEPGDWGGLVFRGATTELTSDAAQLGRASDREDQGIFLNYVGQANISYGGGTVVVDSQPAVYNPIHMITSRPTAAFNTITNSADAAVSADPDSFGETLFRDENSTSEYRRVGPEIHGNVLTDNSINGLFVRIRTEAGVPIDVLHVQARFNDTDIVHVITENLLVQGTPGGPLQDGAVQKARPDARLAIDPGIVVKSKGSRIEVGVGAQLIAEGTASNRVIFTSLADDRYGAGGTFDTTSDATDPNAPDAAAGDWGGINFDPVSKGSLDHVLITFAGGNTPIEGTFASFNAIEIRQAEVRLANSIFETNDDGFGDNAGSDRNGRGWNAPATIFVRGSQPVIVNNIIRGNEGDAISINANAMNTRLLGDYGRSTGFVDAYTQFNDNSGPLVRLNRVVDNDINGLEVRGATLTAESKWDDVDIVHVLRQTIEIPNLHVYGGLRLQSSPTQSLVVKLAGATAGFTASGKPLDIDDRIGGTLEVLGTPGHPVVLTSLDDETVGAGFNLQGQPQNKTLGGSDATPLPGDWKGITLDQYSNDRNVDVTNELEVGYTGPNDVNSTPSTAQFLGTLAANQQNGDDNRRLGFEIHGSISYDRPGDLDLYSFNGVAGTQVWLDLDRTAVSLDTVLELVDANGTVLARSNNSDDESANPLLLNNLLAGNKAKILQQGSFSSEDLYTTNPRDAGMRVVLPGTVGTTNTYYVRVRSYSANLNTNLTGGQTSGDYQLQIRLQEIDEFPGSTVRFADIRFATNGIQVLGLPYHSPQVGESAGSPVTNVILPAAQSLGNLLSSDRNAISIASAIANPLDVDWFKFTIDYQDIQAIADVNDGGKTWATVFDIDYADGLSRPNLVLSVFDDLGNLVWVSRDSSVADDQPDPMGGSSAADLTRGSFGKMDPFLGTIQMPEGTSRTYYVAVSSNAQLPTQLIATFNGNDTQKLIRMEPVTSVRRIVEDHIGTTGYNDSAGTNIAPTTPAILPIQNTTQLQASVQPYTLGDMVLYVSQNSTAWGRLQIVNPLTGAVIADLGNTRAGDEVGEGRTPQDITMRTDGVLYAAQRGLFNDDGNSGRLVILDPTNAKAYVLGEDGIPSVPVNDGVPEKDAVDQLTSYSVDALSFARFPANGTVSGTGFDYEYQAWIPDSLEHYDLYYAVTDATTGQSHLYRANPTTGDATHADDGPFGPVNSAFLEVPDNYSPLLYPSLDTPIFDPTGQFDISTVTGMSFIQRQGITIFAPSPDEIADGQTFRVSDSDTTIEFEFDKTGNGVSGTRFPVNVAGATTQNDVLLAMLSAISASGLTITFQFSGFFGSAQLIDAYSGEGRDSTVEFSDLPGYGQTLYGVDDAGHFFTINAPVGESVFGGFLFGNAGEVYNVKQLNPTSPFTGLTAAPRNLDFNRDGILGDLRDTVFASCRNGDIYAIDTLTGQFRTDIFPGGVDHISTFLPNVTGLAFSSLDTNLWHPTNLNGDAPGHGVQLSPDLSRIPTSDKAEETGVSTMGGTSFYFGFENYSTDPNVSYLRYAQAGPSGVRNENSQYGILKQDTQFDLTANKQFSSVIGNNSFAPPPLQSGGEEELRNNTLVGNNYNFPLARGSLITNAFSLQGYEYGDKPTVYFNYYLDAAFDTTVNGDTAKVYISDDNGLTWDLIATNDPRRADNPNSLPKFTSTSSDASPDANQLVQQLFTANRTTDDPPIVDNTWRQARIDIGNYAGQSNLKLKFEFRAGIGTNNTGGFAIDDILVGFTGRGEMVTRPVPYITNPDSGPPVPGDPSFAELPSDPDKSYSQVLVGPYQLEIRRGNEYNLGVSSEGIIGLDPTKIRDINDRDVQDYTLVAPRGTALADGQTIVISDGVNRVTFEFDSNGAVTSGNFAIPFVASDSAVKVAKSIRDAVNGRYGSTFGVSASSIATSDRVDLFRAVDFDASGAPSFVNGINILRWDFVGDRNLPRSAQGEIILQSNKILGSLAFGITVTPGPVDASGTHPGAPRNLLSINTDRQAPGVVIANNLIAASQLGGILYSGMPDSAVLPPSVVPFGRIINNTIFGNLVASGIGVQVTNNAAPTLLNNIFSNLLTGIDIDQSSLSKAVVGASLYKGNGIDLTPAAVESNSIKLLGSDPLFVNAAGGNFNLAPNSKAIDSAINSLQDRQSMITINAPVGIGPSPILAPLNDLNGKLRVDDPTVLPPAGLGSNVFKDRGALDRSDFTGPKAVLVNPQDNDTGGIDQDSNLNYVLPAGSVLSDFQIQLVDGTGIGIDALTVSSSKFFLTRNGVTLVDGVDYIFGYDQTNQIVRFTPIPGIWLPDATYVIKLDNSVASGIKDLAANPLLPNELTGITQFTIVLKPLDFGDAPLPYPTKVKENGARHVIVPGVYLGSGVTADTEGRPATNALGDIDSTTQLDSDDGVVFTTPAVPGTPYVPGILGVPGIQSSVTITASAPGFIDGFVDLNADGDWDDAGEKFLNSVPVVAGQNQLKFTLPAATAVNTFARFRYSTTGGLGPTGVANSGEVEDYAVTIPATVSYTVQLFNPVTGKEYIKDKQGRYVVLPNSQIEARVYVDDTRNIGSLGGVFGAFADLTSSQQYVQWNAASLDVDDAFPTGQSGTADATFGVDEAGGISSVILPVGADLKQHLFTIRGSILPTVTMGTTFPITLDKADQSPAHNTLVYGLNSAVAATYQNLEVVVPASAWQNPYEPLDVFPDGYISGLDALLIINELNRPGGPLPLDPTPEAPNVPPPYLDVDGDGLVTATDVLLVINELNHPKLPSPFPVPSEAVLSPAAPQAAPAASAPVASAAVSSAPVADLVASTSIDVMSAVPAPAAASAVPKLTDLAMTVYDNLGESLLAIDSADLTAANRSDLVGDVVRELAATVPVARVADRSATAARKLLDSSDGALAGLAQFFAAHADDDSLLDLGRSALSHARGESIGLLAKRRRGG